MIAGLTWLSITCYAQIQVSEKGSPQAFPIVADGKCATVYVSPKEEQLVKKVAEMFTGDIKLVTDIKSETVVKNEVEGENAIVVATIGKNKWVDRLIVQKRIDVSKIKNGWEQYAIQIVEKPQKGIDQALVVVGSDKRGAAYGLLSISEKMGVSPYYWWADVPVQHKAAVYLTGNDVSRRPSVKYRGLFINDEDWGMKPWSSNNYEKDLGDIGPKTYAKVCELILRLKGNMLGPAMHACTGAFYSHPESKVVADSYGILITTSHCEPLLINTASKWEWDVERDGDWNYATNAKAVQKKWNDRLDIASCYDNIYTMGMRGLHDAGLRGNIPMDQQVTLVGQIIRDQRTMLKKHIGKNIKDIPQIFLPYKEAMDVYENGLQVPEDITLVWVDDNYGYLKRVSNPAEQQRSGHSGVYYHLSYLGAPHDYLWLNTTPPVLMYEELMKAYRTGADRYWLLNVGDIKPMELGMKTFFDLAWNVDGFDVQSINRHQSQYLGTLFGKAYIPRFQNILDNYYRLAWSRKPEFMGWEREWDSKEYTGLKDTEYSFQNYGEAQMRLQDYERISNDVKTLLHELPLSQHAAFFEMVAFPVMASAQMTRKFLMAQLNHEQFNLGHAAAANWAARQSRQSYDSIAALNRKYNTMLGGKWDGMMDLAPGWCALYQNMPEVNYTNGAGEEPIDLSVKHEDLNRCYVVNLEDYSNKVENNGSKISLVAGIGYDWKVVQLGIPSGHTADASNVNGDRIEYTLPAIDADQVEITLYTVPFFPIYKGKTTKVGVSVDGCQPQVFNNQFQEYGLSWKNQVLRNAAVARLKFNIDKSKSSHVLSLVCGDSGMMVQKVVVDWGGLKKSYLGPVNCEINNKR